MNKLLCCFLFLVLSLHAYANPKAGADAGLVKMKIEPARLIAYELEDRFDDFNETLKRKTGLFAGYVKPKEIYVEITYYTENKEFSPFARTKTEYWVSEIIKKYGIKRTDFVVTFHDVVLE